MDGRRDAPWLPRPAVVGSAMLVLATAVMITVGLHATALGADPSWAFDCNDTTCEDLWIGPRRHYRRITAGCTLAIFAGWAIVGAGLRSTGTHPADLDARRTPRAPHIGTLAVAGAPLLSAFLGGYLAIASTPLALAGVIIPLLVAGVFAWNGLRSRRCGSRSAWYLAGGTMIFAAVVSAAIMALSFWGLFLLAIPVGALCGGVLAAVLHLWSGRWLVRRTAQGRPGPEHLASVHPRPFVADVLCVLVLVLAAVWSAWPVPAAPADAWIYGGPAHSSPSRHGWTRASS